MKKVQWGVLGAARIAVEKVIPAMMEGRYSTVVAIASRSLARSRAVARRLGVPKAYGTYEALLQDPDVEAIYNPLPNHLHVPWSIQAARAGKHVLCEKPLALSAKEALKLLDARDRAGVLVQEAVMVRMHPQWLATREILRRGKIGEARAVLGFFSYFNRDPTNVRNIARMGGGGLLDIGFYPITTSRFFFEEEPSRVLGIMERDPKMKIDRLTSAILDFPRGHSVFTVSTQLVPYQRMQFFGTRGRIEVEIPFNAPPDRPCRIFADDGSDFNGRGIQTIAFDACNQYTIQGDLFSRAIRDGAEAPVPLEDSVNNMAVIDAIFRSAKSGKWERPKPYQTFFSRSRI
jgi:predicted dehydrogenase